MMKTSTMISLMIFASVFTPRPMVWGGPDEESVNSDFTEKHYPMLERCEATKWQLQPKSRRGTKAILLKRCRVRKAYSGGKATVAGFPACYVFVTEADKWTKNKSTEADNFQNIRERCKGYPLESKEIIEGTPSTVIDSRVWKLVTDPTTDQRLLYVPCPHCGEFQVLVRGSKNTPYGLKFESRTNGKRDVARAMRTAYYECRHCHGKILDHHRHEMMRRCKWLSKGQSIDKHGKITGKREVESPVVALGPCSSLYSLWFGWGQAAKEIVQAGNNREEIKKNTNSFWAEAFDPKPQSVEPHEVAKRLVDPSTTWQIVPEWGIFLTRGVDVQDDGKTFEWVISAWGPGGRGHEIEHGTTHGVEEFQKLCRAQVYQHADGGRPLPVLLTMIDSGDATVSVYELCRNWKGGGSCLPVKGSSTSDFAETFRQSRMDEDGEPVSGRQKVKRGGLVLIIVNTERSELWIEGHVTGGHQDTEVARYTITPEAALDIGYLTELANGYKDDKGNWKKHGVNDKRDATRYSWIGECYITNHGKHRNCLPARPTLAQRTAATQQRTKKPNPYTEGTGRWDEA